MSVKRLVTIAFIAAIQYVCFTSFSFILYLEVITFVTLSFAMVFPKKDVVMASSIFAIINMLSMGVNPWTFMYLLIYPSYSFVIASLAKILKNNFFLLVFLCGLFSFLTGQFVQIPFLLFSKNITIYYILAGLKVSIPQGIIAGFVCFLLFKPLNIVLLNIKEKMYKHEKIN
jgi:flavin reductase (DIM6/NTAB) family NADH-FMN oxidoreductase RutF